MKWTDLKGELSKVWQYLSRHDGSDTCLEREENQASFRRKLKEDKTLEKKKVDLVSTDLVFTPL